MSDLATSISIASCSDGLFVSDTDPWDAATTDSDCDGDPDTLSGDSTSRPALVEDTSP